MTTDRYVKRNGYHQQRSKPWHIVRTADSHKEDVVCGAYRSWLAVIGTRWHIDRLMETDTLPDGHIICTKCEVQRDKQ